MNEVTDSTDAPRKMPKAHRDGRGFKIRYHKSYANGSIADRIMKMTDPEQIDTLVYEARWNTGVSEGTVKKLERVAEERKKQIEDCMGFL